MNLAENIRNAFTVVHQTYNNIQRLLEHCKITAEEKDNYVSATDKFLRYKSDNDYSGWYIKDFILLFQRKSDPTLENEWRDGPIYVIEIELFSDDTDQPKIPTVYLSKFEYSAIESWSKGCSPSNHWRFYYPLRNKDVMNIVSNNGLTIATPKTKELGERYYWGLTKTTSTSISLIDINAENIQEKVFRNFDEL